MIKSNFLLHGKVKASGFMGAEAQDRLANPKSDFCRYTEKPLLDNAFLLFSDTEIEGSCAGSVDFEEFEAKSRGDVKK